MRNRSNILPQLLIVLALSGLALSGGDRTMAQGAVSYRANLVSNKDRSVVVKQEGKTITLSLDGFGKPIKLNANGGGTSTCRTIIEHNSEKATILLSLAIPDPKAPCRMLPSFISVESRSYDISLEEEPVKKVSGSDTQLRSTVQKILGKIATEGEQ
jgi:hypothetical protein